MSGLRTGLVRGLSATFAVALCLGITACTGEDTPDASARTSSAAAPESPSESPGTASPSASVGSTAGIEQILSPPASQPLASFTARLQTGEQKSNFAVDILGLEADGQGTYLRYRITAADGSSKPPHVYDKTRRSWNVAESVTLVDPVAKARAKSLFWDRKAGVVPVGCACSTMPFYDLGSKGTELSALFPPISAEATEVRVEFPGAAPVTVPVTRT